MVTTEDFKYALTILDSHSPGGFIKRDIKIDLNSNKIIAIAGARRTGKTYVMFQYINDLKERGVAKDNILYINFENERLIGLNAKDMDLLLVAHKELFNPDGKIYIFLDEIQVVENWDKWVRKIYDTGNYQIILTGSSSELLSSEIATSLAGRNLTYTIYPLSFSEYISAKGLKVDKLLKYSTDRGTILKAVRSFLEYGSFPEIAVLGDNTRKLEILSSYFDAIFFKDIVRRYRIREINELRIFLRILCSNYASYFSSVRVLNTFKSMGWNINRATILNFLEYSSNVFLVQKLEQYEKSTTRRLTLHKKVYTIDTGISRLFSDINMGRALENAVYLELLRKRNKDISYLKLKSGKEIDFVVGERTKEIIQVCYDVSDPDTRSREVSALLEGAKYFGLKAAKIITYVFEDEEIIEGIKIQYIPFWIWALNELK